MGLRLIVHPKIFKVADYKFEVAAFCKITDEQARKIVLHFYRNSKLKKKDKDKIIRIATVYNEQSIKRL